MPGGLFRCPGERLGQKMKRLFESTAARRAFLRTAGRGIVPYTELPTGWAISRVTCAAEVPSPVGPLRCQGVSFPCRRSSSR